MYRQLQLFDVKDAHSYQCSDYIVLQNNRHTYNLLLNSDFWRSFVLYGKAGSGKTHLAHIWQKLKNATFLAPDQVEESIRSISASHAVIIEDIDNIKNESWILHCYNHALENSKPLLLTSSLPPSLIKFRLKDLESRIVSTMNASLADPTEELLRIALVKLFTNHQMHIDTKTISYILNNTERSFKKLSDIVNLIYTELPTSTSGVTIPFVKSIMRKGDFV